MTDPIADLLTRIRNAHLAKKEELSLPHSKLKEQILFILQNDGWISKVDKKPSGINNVLHITLRYDEEGQPAIKHIKRVSRPGRRVYVDRNNLPIVLNNYGVAVVSTSRGLMTNRDARKKHLGGEVLFELY